MKQQGFGFLVLFNGRLDSELKTSDPAKFGTMDGRAAVAAAAKEGFPKNVLIFLDQEEGGRLFSEQIAYIFAWADEVRSAGARAGIYCSGIDVPDGQTTISTARDIAAHEKARIAARKLDTSSAHHGSLALWIVNDECPPSPGCTSTRELPTVGLASPGVVVWQYVRSPITQFGAACRKTYAPDGNCYASGLPPTTATFLDLDVASSANPSETP
ncbi:MAG TPA: glycoside hydrolase domain-containing protein [Acidobacteriaceae bacterium]|nr:glycoside hydrolase domain-containing protein [Acidobacteriaceae bacterium]